MSIGLSAAGCGNDAETRANQARDSAQEHGADHSAHQSHGQPEAATHAEDAEVVARANGLAIANAYVREPAPGQPVAAAFITLRNASDQAYTLNHVSSPRAANVEVHRSVYEEGMMSMRHVHHLIVAPQSELIFEPGGYHLMLSQFDATLEPGDEVPLKMEFESGLSLEFAAEVRPLR